MKIANTIYDVVFKYLMEDTEIAKDILSAILNEDIISIEFMPQEASKLTEKGIKSMRFDFKCVIKNRRGQLRTVIIEIQKAKTEKQIFRFRGYLGSTYLKQIEVLSATGQKGGISVPITSIYFLGSNLRKVTVPILKVDRVYTDVLTGSVLNVKEDFIENLSHDLYAIQIKRLNKMVNTDLEKILDVFNQEKYKTDDNHILEYTGDTSDPRVDRIVKRLNNATLDYDLLHQLIMEDAYEADLRASKYNEQRAETRAREAEAIAHEAVTKAHEAITKANEAETKANEAETKANEAETKANEAETKANEAETKANEAETKAREAENNLLLGRIAIEEALKEIEKLKQELNNIK
jgi:hypothetical protein